MEVQEVPQIAIGNDCQSVLVMTQYSYTGYPNEYNAYLVDTLQRGHWYGILSHIDGGEQISASKNVSPIALTWFSYDKLYIKMFSQGKWFVTTTFTEIMSDSVRRSPKVAVAVDSSVWVAFSAIRNNARHIFLSKIEPSYVIDTLLTPTEDEQIPGHPLEFSLLQNYPNPFNPSTVIRYNLNQSARVKLEVFNISGQCLAKLVEGYKSAGTYVKDFDGTGFSSGIYFYRLTAMTDQGLVFTDTKKLILIK